MVVVVVVSNLFSSVVAVEVEVEVEERRKPRGILPWEVALLHRLLELQRIGPLVTVVVVVVVAVVVVEEEEEELAVGCVM